MDKRIEILKKNYPPSYVPELMGRNEPLMESMQEYAEWMAKEAFYEGLVTKGATDPEDDW